MKQKPSHPDVAVAYIRVSTMEQSIGPDVQRVAIERWCERHGVRLACPPFVDHGVSGGLEFDKRPALLAAYDAVHAHRAGILVAHKRDRVARDREVMGNLSLLLRKSGCRICTTDRPPGNHETMDPMEKALEGIQDVFAELERSIIRARTKAALRVMQGRGERVGTIPYGRRLADDGVLLIPDAKEQRTIRLILKLRKQNLSLRAIGAHLEEVGVSPRSGGRWHAKVISSILKANTKKP